MASFGQLILTNAGLQAQYKAQSGESLKFKRIGMGSGEFSGNIAALTALVKEDISVAVINGYTQNNAYVVEGFFSNEALNVGFAWREIGLFAEDSDGNEVLYCYANAGDTYDYIPATGDERYSKYIRIATAIGNATNVSIVENEGLIYVDTATFAREKDAIYLAIENITPASLGAHSLSTRGTPIPSGSDLNNYKTPGDYFVPDAATAASVTNSPLIGTGYKMVVEQGYGTMGTHIYQFMVGWGPVFFCRQYRLDTDTWSEWRKVYDTENKPTAADVDAHALSERGALIPENSNLDNYKTPGDYFAASAKEAATLTNTPMTGSGFRLIVEAGYVPGYIRQYAIGVSGNIQTRYFQTSWSPWVKIVNTGDMEDEIHYHATKQLSNQDLNSILTPGFYYAPGSNTCANSPAPVNSGFGLEVAQSAGGYYTQIGIVANALHIRYYNGSVWSDWKQLYTEVNKPTPAAIGALPVSGGKLTGALILTEGVHYGDTLPKAGTPGRIFFLKV